MNLSSKQQSKNDLVLLNQQRLDSCQFRQFYWIANFFFSIANKLLRIPPWLEANSECIRCERMQENYMKLRWITFQDSQVNLFASHSIQPAELYMSNGQWASSTRLKVHITNSLVNMVRKSINCSQIKAINRNKSFFVQQTMSKHTLTTNILNTTLLLRQIRTKCL